MSKFEVGTRVGDIDPDDLEIFNENEDTSRYGEVIEVIDDSQVRVKWDADWRGQFEEIVLVYDLHLESELKQSLSTLEKEYEEVSAKVKAKVGEASSLLEEAADIASEYGTTLSKMYAGRAILGAMRYAGWRTSGMSC